MPQEPCKARLSKLRSALHEARVLRARGGLVIRVGKVRKYAHGIDVPRAAQRLRQRGQFIPRLSAPMRCSPVSIFTCTRARRPACAAAASSADTNSADPAASSSPAATAAGSWKGRALPSTRMSFSKPCCLSASPSDTCATATRAHGVELRSRRGHAPQPQPVCVILQNRDELHPAGREASRVFIFFLNIFISICRYELFIIFIAFCIIHTADLMSNHIITARRLPCKLYFSRFVQIVKPGMKKRP